MNEAALKCGDVAVIGMACRFPGSPDYTTFWDHLWAGDNLVSEIPPDRPRLASAYSPEADRPGGSISKWGGFLDQIDAFDHRFFNVSPREARNMDPQQRLLLEETWHCLEDAAVPLDRLQQARTAVYVGAMSIDYYQDMLAAEVETDGYACSGTFSCILANRLSYFLGFRGASMAVDTACSSSLVALHEARQSILSGASDYAVVAGVSLNFNPWKYVSFSKARMLSPDGRCKVFDQDANGYVPGEGVGVLLLQPLERARAEGRRIHAIIKGSAVNHGGQADSLTAPGVQAQCDVILEAMASAEITADSVTYLEAHGTGTSLGDPIEVEALTRAFARHTPSRQFCRIGSVKSNLGHLEAAAGVAGLIKVILMMKHRAIPATLNLQTPNPLIDFHHSPFQLADRPLPWARPDDLLRAGVSSFGFGGVNSHVIVESAPSTGASAGSSAPVHGNPSAGEPFLFLLSAKSAASLEKLLACWSKHLQTADYSRQKLKDVCLTLLHGRETFPHRFGACILNKSDLEKALAAARQNRPVRGLVPAWRLLLETPWPVSQGGQGRDAFEPRGFEQIWLACQDAFQKLTSATANPLEARQAGGLSAANKGRLRQLARTIAASRMLFQFLGPPREIAFEPGAAAAALYLSEALTLDEAVAWTIDPGAPPQRLCYPRIALVHSALGRALQPFSITAGYLQALVGGIAPGSKTAAALFDQATRLFDRQFTFRRHLEAWDQPLRPVHGGIRELLAKANEENADPNQNVGRTVLLIAILESLQKVNRKWGLSLDQNIPGENPRELIDLLGDGVLEREEAVLLIADPARNAGSIASSADSRLALLGSHRDYSLLRSFHSRGIEISNWAEWWTQAPEQTSPAAGSDLTVTLSFGESPAGQGSPDHSLASAQGREEKNFSWDLETGREKNVLTLLLDCWLAGASVAWRDYWPAEGFSIVSLPPYPFDRESFWIRERERPGGELPSTHSPFGGTNPRSRQFEVGSTPLLTDHRIGGKILLPAALLIEMALARGHAFAEGAARGVSDFTILQPALLQPGQIVQIDLAPEPSGFVVRMGPVALARGRLDAPEGAAPRQSLDRYFEGRVISGETFYRELAGRGYEYGPACQVIQRGWRDEEGILFEIKTGGREATDGFACPPCLLDGALQSVLAAVPVFLPDLDVLLLPHEIQSLRQFSALPSECFIRVERCSFRAGEGTVTADAAMFDASGMLVLEIEGLRCKRPSWLSPALNKEKAPESLAGERQDGERVAAGVRVASVSPGKATGPAQQEPVSSDLEKLEDELMGVLAGILRVKQEDVHGQTDLREYGLDSIALTDFAEALSERLALTIDPTDLFEYPSIEGLARYIRGRLSKGPAREGGQAPASGARTSSSAESNGCGNSSLEIGQRDTSPTPSRAWASADEDVRVPLPAGAGELEPKGRPNGHDPDPLLATAAIAVIGMAGRFPKADHLRAFWENLVRGEDCISEFPPDRWNGASWDGPEQAANKSKCKWGGFLRDVAEFDASFFRISPKEAALMDPQQRLVLETSWHALEDAGLKVSSLSESLTGVFVGVCNHDYRELLEKYSRETDAQSATGTYFSIIPNRVSYIFNFRGPSVAIDTACSSSLVAVHQAVGALRGGECDLALAGGVNVCCTPRLYLAFTEAGMLSEDGRCKTFDKRADGYVRGEGVGMIVLKRLAEAVRDGDPIYGVIRGTAVNHGGLANTLTAPNPNAQAALLRKVYTEAQVSAETVGYVEVHGTGTELGDPIEIAGLKKAFSELSLESSAATERKNYCGLGSVKTNIGHLESAAGIAGLIKVLLALKARTLPATIHYRELNPHIEFEGSPFRIVIQTELWDPLRDRAGKAMPRRAGVSSFGFGGTNAHALLEEFLMPERTGRRENGTPEMILLSAKTEDSLRGAARELQAFLSGPEWSGGSLTDLAYTLQVGREEFGWRLAILARTVSELTGKLAASWDDRSKSDGRVLGSAGQQKTSHGRLGDSAADRDFIKSLFHAGQLERIAGFWVSGSAIRWGDLYSPNGRQRISLPGYAFTRERHWIGPVPSPKAESEADGLPQESVKERLFLLFGETLQMKRERIDPDALFGDFGVDSSLLAELVKKIERMIGAAVNPSILLQFPTINELSGYLEQRSGGLVAGAPRTSADERAPQRPAAERPVNGSEGNGAIEVVGSSSAIREAPAPAVPNDRSVAVVGIGCRVPGADTKAAFWEKLRRGQSGLREVPPDRWDVERFYSDVPRKGMSISKWGGFLDNIDLFDANYFQISEAEAMEMDPLARLFLEVSMATLSDAGYSREELSNSATGVFVGSRASSYASHLAEFSKYTPSATGQNFIAAQLSHFLNLKGPNLVVDTACSSSLVSVHLACQSLFTGDCDLALAGGVDLLLDESIYLILSEAKALSSDGKCHTFDLRANGYVPGEGCGVVLLKPLSKAVADGDRIYAVIAGSAINNDGHTMGITTPNLEAQEAVIVAALERAQVNPETVGYVEAHGTGTMIGDPIELKALTRAFRRYTQARQFCAVGSVKTNLGHLHSAAGIASFIKVALALHHREIPPTLHCAEPNPRFEFSESPFYPNLELQPWQQREMVRRSGISSFGFGGTNCHVIAEEFAPEKFPRYHVRRPERPPPVFTRKRYWLPRRPPAAPTGSVISSGEPGVNGARAGQGSFERRRPPPLLVLEEIAVSESDPSA